MAQGWGGLWAKVGGGWAVGKGWGEAGMVGKRVHVNWPACKCHARRRGVYRCEEACTHAHTRTHTAASCPPQASRSGRRISAPLHSSAAAHCACITTSSNARPDPLCQQTAAGTRRRSTIASPPRRRVASATCSCTTTRTARGPTGARRPPHSMTLEPRISAHSSSESGGRASLSY